mgnify:FL=1
MTMDENMLKFDEKLKELLASAKKKKNTLDYQEIMDAFADIDLDPDKMDKIFDFLEASNIDIIRTTDDDMDDEPILLDGDDDIDEFGHNSSHSFTYGSKRTPPLPGRRGRRSRSVPGYPPSLPARFPGHTAPNQQYPETQFYPAKTVQPPPHWHR